MQPSESCSRIAAFEVELSIFIAASGLSSYEAIVAVGVSMARVLYGLECLAGAEAAVDGCEILDKTMVDMWRTLKFGPSRVVN